jgi:hypothetical protein
MRSPKTARARAPYQPRDRVQLIVVELGAAPLSRGPCEDFDQTIAITQTHGESPGHFAQRALARLAHAERASGRVQSAVLLTGHHDAASNAARREIILGLSTHAEAYPGMSELRLQASAGAAAGVRMELLELAGQVTAGAKPSAPPVRIQFGESPYPVSEAKSGVYARPSVSGD